MEALQVQKVWHSKAHQVQRTVNQMWFLTYCAPAFLCGSAFSLVWILTARSLFLGSVCILLPVVGIVLLSLLVAYILVREKFITQAQALELLDERCLMQNRISSALDGALPWPDAPKEIERVLKINFRKPLLQVIMGFALLFLGAVTPPFTGEGSHTVSPTDKPLSLARAEALVEQLTHEELLSPETLAEMQAKVSELSKKSLTEQYEHHALEAADSLQESLQREVSQLTQKLDQASREAKNVESNILSGNRADAAAHHNKLEKLAEELLSGPATPPEALKRALRQAIENESKLMSPEASEALRQQMQELREKLQSAQEQAAQKGAQSQQGNAGEKSGKSSSELDGKNEGGDSVGKDGISRGGNNAVSVNVEKPPQLTSARVENLAKAPQATGTPGELIGLSSQRPEVGTPLPIGEGGAIGIDTQGGKALERQNLTPEESELLERLYK
jgi:hypothetical protein